MRSSILSLVMLATLAAASDAQQGSQAGPVVTSAGPVYRVPSPTFATPMDTELKAVFVLQSPPQSPERTNQQLGTMARYLNMHAQAGVPRESVKVAAVVHGGASVGLLKDEFYRAQNQVDNPNKELIREILAAGGQIVLCGQTAGSRGITQDQLLPGVQLALSAMTALTVLQNQGYRVILW